MWARPTTRSIRVQSLQTILLIVLLLGSMTAIIWVAIAVQGEAPRPPAPETPAEGPAAWLSAWSTFWGAVATALGAILTGGALLIAALTYQRQIHDKHVELEDKRREELKKRREQAEGVTVRIAKYKPVVVNMGERPPERRNIIVRNDGKLAVFAVSVVVLNKERKEADQRYFHSILSSNEERFLCPADETDGVYTTFTDAAGVRWKRWHNGDLDEISHYPKPGE